MEIISWNELISMHFLLSQQEGIYLIYWEQSQYLQWINHEVKLEYISQIVDR